MEVVQCMRCGLGVVSSLPESTKAYYHDSYYVGGGHAGYEDYRLMAEHGLGWAAAVVQLLAKDGKVLDIGCADGYLLDKLSGDFDKYGIEVNAKAAEQAADKRIQILGNDLLDPQLVRDHRAAFNVVTAIAVFEHLLDFRGGFQTAIDLLTDDGFILFEVPVMSADQSNAAWMQSSFEHIYYPTEASLRWIVETSLGCQLTGAEIAIKDYASTYIGIVTKNVNQAERAKSLFDRLVRADFEASSVDEVRAATHLHLIHAGQASRESVLSLSRLNAEALNPRLMARIAQLWSFDLRRLDAASAHLPSVDAGPGHSEALLVDAKALESANKRAAASEAAITRLRSMLLIEMGRTRDSELRVAEAQHHVQVMQQSVAWRAMGVMRRFTKQNPRLAKRLRQTAKVVWWTLRGTIFVHLREIRRRKSVDANALLSNAKTQADNAAFDEAASKVNLLPSACFLPNLVDQPSGADWPADRPLVSIVIPCFNYGHLVADAIRSAEAQTFANIEIIVVEGGSTSAESRQRLFDAAANASSRVRVVVQDQPHRAGANRNFGISHARGKYISCLDADDRFAATYIEKAVFMLEHSGYDVVSPGLQFFGDRTEVWAPHERPTLDMLLEGNNALTCAVYSKAFWVKAGGYRDSDRTTGHIHEDWLFWVRLAALGARFVCIREPLFYYRSHGETLSNSADVLSNEVQKRLVFRFNEDVLTDAALSLVRTQSSLRPLRPLLLSAASQHVGAVAPHAGPTLLMALPFLVLGGAERLLSALVGQLAKNGWRVIIVTTIPVDQAHGDTTSWFEPATAEIFHLPRFLEQEYWRDFLDHILVSRDVQLLWVIGSAFIYEQLPTLRLAYPEMAVADLLFNTVGHTANNRRYADCIDRVFVENQEVKQWLIAAGESPASIGLVESGIDLTKNTPPLNDDVRSAIGEIPAGAVVVGFFGRWSEEKDPLGFVEIARRLSAELNVVCVMTGAGHVEAELIKAIASASFKPGRFVLKGAVPDLKPYLQACDILCLPSLLDGRPNIVMEALASGTAVIASRVGALPELIEDGEQGYLCTPGAYDEFAKKIGELAADKDKLNRFKQAARRHAERRFDIDAMFHQYETQLASLIKSHRVN